MNKSLKYVLFSLVALQAVSQNINSTPNVLFIMVDDLRPELNVYGKDFIKSPNIDALAEMGVRYTQFMNTSRCCPSRAALLSGNYPHHVNMGWMTAVDEHRDGYRGELTAAYPTLAEILSGANYATAMSGKWHLTLDLRIEEPPNGSWPTERGFDQFFGCLAGGGSYRRHGRYVDGTEFIPKESLPSGFYYTDAITTRAVKFIEDHEPSQPLFLYLAHYAPHRPLDAPKNRTEIYFEFENHVGEEKKFLHAIVKELVEFKKFKIFIRYINHW